MKKYIYLIIVSFSVAALAEIVWYYLLDEVFSWKDVIFMAIIVIMVLLLTNKEKYFGKKVGQTE